MPREATPKTLAGGAQGFNFCFSARLWLPFNIAFPEKKIRRTPVL